MKDLISREDTVTRICRMAENLPEPDRSRYIMIALFIRNVEEFPTIMSERLEEDDLK